MSLTTSVSSTHTYQGKLSEINFFLNEDNALKVTIETERLHIESVTSSEEDCASYAALFGDPQVMEKYATGQTKTEEEITDRIKNSWVKRWEQNDPYSALKVLEKNTDEFIGHVVLGHGGLPGQGELAYLVRKNCWRQGVGKTTVVSVVQEYAPATVREGYTLEGKVLNTITATTRQDNPYSIAILKKAGMEKTHEEEKYGARRDHFSIDLSTLGETIKKV